MELGESSQKVQTSNYRINKFWECNIQYYIIYLQVAKRVGFKNSHHKEKIITIWTWWILTNLIVVIILQHIQKSNNYIDTLNLHNDICQLYLNRTGREKPIVLTYHSNSFWKHRSKFQGGFPQGYRKKNLSLSLAEPVSWNIKREGLKWKRAKEFKVKKREIKINYCSGFLTYFISLHLHNQILQMKKSKGFSSVQFSHSVMSDSLWPHGLQHSRPPCPSPTPGDCSNSCLSSQWCHPTISFSVCRPLLILPLIFPSIRVFSNESVLHIRWPKYWSFSFSINPSTKYSGLITFTIDWLDFLAVQGTHKSFLQHHSSKVSILWCSDFFMVQLSHPFMTTEKNHSFD